MKEFLHGFRREFWDLAVKLIFEASAGINKTDFFSVFRFVQGLEVVKSELAALIFSAPDCGGRAVAEQAKADKHARFVVEVESG